MDKQIQNALNIIKIFNQQLNQKLNFITKNPIYFNVFSPMLLFYIEKIKIKIKFLKNIYSSDIEKYVESMEDIERIEEAVIFIEDRIREDFKKFVITDDIRDKIKEVKDRYFYLNSKNEIIDNICDLFNIEIKNERDRREVNKVNDGYEVYVYRGEYLDIFHELIRVILFGDDAVHNSNDVYYYHSDEISFLCTIFIRNIFFPDDIMLEKAKEFDYDCVVLSKYFGFSKLCMYINLIRLQSEKKIPDDVEIYLRNGYSYD